MSLKDYIDYCNLQMQSESKEDNCAPVGNSFVYTGLSKLPANPVSAMAYVPFQINSAMYETEKALCRGTAFPDLDKPFLGGKCI